MKLSGSRIITRVDGKNWIYKYSYLNLKFFISSILKNFSILFFQILADKIIYQSEFVKKEWQNFLFNKKCKIIYNGAKPNFVLRNFSRSKKPTFISVEGSIDAAFNSYNLIKAIAYSYNYNYEIYGSVSQKTIKKFKNFKNVNFFGPINRKQILKILAKRKKYIFISLEMFAPCPNSVIEAINHGIPVIGYNQGSMREIISMNNGILLNVSNKLTVNKSKLAKSILKINNNYNFFNKKLKKINKKFTLKYMLRRYESEILDT